MSVECLGWAFRQKVPLNAKCVLLALADQADSRTGRVCYGRTDVKYLAEKCGIGIRSLWRFVGALILNGYVIKESGKLEGKASAYWLCLDREPADDIKEWRWTAEAIGDEPEGSEPQDIVGPDEGVPTESEDENNENDENRVTPGMQQHGTARVSCFTKEHKRSRKTKPAAFDRGAQDLERGIGKKEETDKKEVFVIEGTRAWIAQCEYRKNYLDGISTYPTCWGPGKYATKRGWYFASLFPPTKDQPLSDYMTEDDEQALTELR